MPEPDRQGKQPRPPRRQPLPPLVDPRLMPDVGIEDDAWAESDVPVERDPADAERRG